MCWIYKVGGRKLCVIGSEMSFRSCFTNYPSYFYFLQYLECFVFSYIRLSIQDVQVNKNVKADEGERGMATLPTSHDKTGLTNLPQVSEQKNVGPKHGALTSQVSAGKICPW